MFMCAGQEQEGVDACYVQYEGVFLWRLGILFAAESCAEIPQRGTCTVYLLTVRCCSCAQIDRKGGDCFLDVVQKGAGRP